MSFLFLSANELYIKPKITILPGDLYNFPAQKKVFKMEMNTD